MKSKTAIRAARKAKDEKIEAMEAEVIAAGRVPKGLKKSAKKKKPSGKSAKTSQTQLSSPKPITKDDLIASVALDYNVLRMKLPKFVVEPDLLRRSQEALETSYLLYRAAVEKVEVPG